MKSQSKVAFYKTLSLRKKMILALCLTFLSSLSACFGAKDNLGKVRGYKPGKVLTKTGEYQVGPLPNTWALVKVKKYQTLIFRNSSFKSTIFTDAYCEAGYDDASLSTLTTHLQFELNNKKNISSKTLTLSGREALHTIAEGSVDGVMMILDSVVIKKDECLFDFVLISPPSFFHSAEADFENFYSGFGFTGKL